MPTDHILIGGAPAVAQVDLLTFPTDVETDQVITATINNKSIEYTLPAGPLVLSVAANFVDLWNASEIPEFQEVTATDNGDGTITLTADTEGKPFTVVFLLGSDTNEIQVITIVGTATGGTFTLTFDGETTGSIAYNASAATVEAALEALSNIGVGNVDVTGSAGGPYTVEFTGALADTDVAKITADTTALEGVNEIQTVTLNTATGGTFTLTFEGEETSALAYNASAAAVEAALEALSNIGVGNVDVTGSAGGPYAVEFIGTLAKVDQAALVFDGANLTGGLAASVAETTPGGGGVSELWQVRINSAGNSDGAFTITGDNSVSAGTFILSLSIDSDVIFTTAAIAYDATLSEVQAALDAAPRLATGGNYQYAVYVREGSSTGTGQLSDGDTVYFNITPEAGKTAATMAAAVTLTNSLTGGTYTKASPSNPQYDSMDSDLTSFFITVDGESTDDISVTATNATVQAAIEALTTVGAGNVTVTGDTGQGSYPMRRLEFIGDLANQATGLSVTIGTNTATVSPDSKSHLIHSGAAGTSEVQTLTITGSPGAGTFGLSYEGEETAALAYNASAATVQTALEGLTTVGTGNVVCTGGDLPGTAVVMTFQNALGGTDLNMVAVIGGTTAETQAATDGPEIEVTTTQAPLTHTTTTAAEGPNDWKTAANWDTNTVPVNGDNVFILDGDSLWYGPDSLVTLTRLEIHNYGVEMGLPRRNANYYEYRPTHLKITATDIIIGIGDAGPGSNMIKLDIETSSPIIEVRDSGTGQDGEAAIQIKGDATPNTAEILVLGGEVALVPMPKEEAYFKKITIREGEVHFGAGLTYEELIKSGGELTSNRSTLDGPISL